MSFDLIWKDIQVVISTCCTLEEKRRIWFEAQGHADKMAAIQPDRHPVGTTEWNYQLGQGDLIKRNHDTLLKEMKKCTVKPVNYDKIKEVTQDWEENLAIFQGQLVEAFWRFTNIVPRSPEGWFLLSQHFLNQSVPDISVALRL